MKQKEKKNLLSENVFRNKWKGKKDKNLFQLDKKKSQVHLYTLSSIWPVIVIIFSYPSEIDKGLFIN